MNAPENITLARKLGSAEMQIMPAGETMSMSWLDASCYIRADVAQAMVQKARDEALEEVATWLHDRTNTCLEYNQPDAAGMTISYAEAIRALKGGEA